MRERVLTARVARRSGLHALSLAPLDPRDACGGSEDARAPVVPADAEARRILGQNLLDDARPTRLSSPLRLDDDPVFHARVHGSALLRFDLVNQTLARVTPG